jgi:hypothetical protein
MLLPSVPIMGTTAVPCRAARTDMAEPIRMRPVRAWDSIPASERTELHAYRWYEPTIAPDEVRCTAASQERVAGHGIMYRRCYAASVLGGDRCATHDSEKRHLQHAAQNINRWLQLVRQNRRMAVEPERLHRCPECGLLHGLPPNKVDATH